MRDRKWQQRFTLFLGIFLSFGMVAGLVLPLAQNWVNQRQQQQVARPTDTPPPTPPPVPDTATIGFTETYLHPSGLFTAAIPTGYVLTNEFNSTGEAQVTMENPDALSVLEIRVIRPTDQVSLDSAQALGEQFSQSWLQSSWSRYSSWDEDARTVEDDRLVMDFNLTRNRANYVARQVAFTDGTWIYTIRVVSPSNASSVMQYVLENEVDSFQTIERFVGEPLEWSGYFDRVNNHLLRFPQEWIIVDDGVGAPTSIGGNNTQLLVQTNPTPLTTEEAAREYVNSLRSNVEILSVETVEQYDLTGFQVAYTIPTVDGATQSGVVLILNTDSQAHIANALLTDVENTDLNTVDVTAEGVASNIVQVLDLLGSFSVFPELEIADY